MNMRDAKDLRSRLLMGAKPSPVRRVRLPVEDRVYLAATDQNIRHVTEHVERLIALLMGEMKRLEL